LGLEPLPAVLVVLVTATGLIDISQDVGIWIFRAHDRQDLEGLVLLTSQVAWLAGIAACAALRLPVAYALRAATVAFLLRLAVGAFALSRTLYAAVFAPEWGRLKSLTAEGLPFGLAMFTVVLYGRVGVLLLKAFATDADVAYFNIGYMLSQPLGFVSSALSISVFPSLARRA